MKSGRVVVLAAFLMSLREMSILKVDSRIGNVDELEIDGDQGGSQHRYVEACR